LFLLRRCTEDDGATQKIIFFLAHDILLRNFIAHYWNMSTKRKKDQTATAVAQVNNGRRTIQYTVEDVVKLVRFSFKPTPDKLPL
jgi:hypothetical protein